MASLMTEKSKDELLNDMYEAALTEDIQRTEKMEAMEDLRGSESFTSKELKEDMAALKALDAEVERKTQKPLIEKDQTLRIDLPVDQLLNASRTEKKLFFSQLIKEIKGNIEMIRIQRRLEQ